MFDFPLGFLAGQAWVLGGQGLTYCEALLFLLVAFEIQMVPTGKSQAGRVHRFYFCERGMSW